MLANLLGLALATMTSSDLPETLRDVHSIVFLGDSITQQGGAPGGYVWLVQQNLKAIFPDAKIEVHNSGISGNKSTDMLGRFQKDVLDYKPDLVVISVGVNDVWHGFYDHPKGDGPLGIPLNQYRQNVEVMLSQAKSHGAKITLLSATPIGEDLSNLENQTALAYNQVLSNIAPLYGAKFVDLQVPFRKLITEYRGTTGSTLNSLTVDGVHMTELGNQVMASMVLGSWGVTDQQLQSAVPKIQANRHPADTAVALPKGMVVSDGCPATASSQTEGYGASQASIPYSAGGTERWCAADGEFQPSPWWQVDLGSAKNLTGIQLFFAPSDPDTWHYRIEVSNDGQKFELAEDQSKNEIAIAKAVHIFTKPVNGRYVRVVFTAPTRAVNWASLHRVLVFADK